jgi:hypothetical protein
LANEEEVELGAKAAETIVNKAAKEGFEEADRVAEDAAAAGAKDATPGKAPVRGPGSGPDIANDLDGLPKGKQPHVRTVGTEDELDSLYSKWSEGGNDITPKGYNGKLVELPDGSIVGLRNASKSGGATIDIKLPNGTVQKVHIDGP